MDLTVGDRVDRKSKAPPEFDLVAKGIQASASFPGGGRQWASIEVGEEVHSHLSSRSKLRVAGYCGEVTGS